MAIKKSDLYASLWASCDELRGGMDASQYKDYVLFMLFIKYISDKYADSKQFEPPVIIPKGASYSDMVALKGKPDIGDKINTQVIQPLISANDRLARSDFPDFNDPNKLGEGQAMVDRLTNLIAIFQKPELDFSGNRAENDDILGDAYEYLMRLFATESGKSKGQFYTPSEVSRVIAQVLEVTPKNTVGATRVYDPTCGSGSLLLKIAAQAGKQITLEGQEMDVSTAGLARMNMIIHDFPTAHIEQGNTLSDPKFKDEKGTGLRTYDYVVANPPFSVKTWRVGMTPESDPYQRFAWGVPPAKQGDYAFLLHIIRSMKSTGKAACILPHGTLFRGNAEEGIRRKLVESGYLKGIIGLPANLFYGTGIPACILVLDKEGADKRTGIFMLDASKGFIKDGAKNRLREQDVHKIVDTFVRQDGSDPRYARLVPVSEIADPKNNFNLNLPRYIDSSEPEDLQDIDGHLRGGIPERDVKALEEYWKIMPTLRAQLFEPFDKTGSRKGYLRLVPSAADIKAAIFTHAEFAAFQEKSTKVFEIWKSETSPLLKRFSKGGNPKALITSIAETLLAAFRDEPLLDPYDIYQHLMDYWAESMQDDAYLIAADGWVAVPARIVETDKKGKSKDKGWTCDLIPKSLIVNRYFATEQAALESRQAELETATATLAELEEEHGGEDGYLGSLDKIAKGEVNTRLKEIKGDTEANDETAVLALWLDLYEQESTLKRAVKDQDAALDTLAYTKYSKLTEAEIKTLVVDDKWMARLSAAVQAELDRVSQTLTGRIRELAERYATPLPKLTDEVETLAAQVDEHLKKMGASRLPGFSGEWEVVRLGDIATVLKGSGLSKGLIEATGAHPCILYGELFTKYGRVIDNVVSRTHSSGPCKSVSGDVLLPGSTTTTGADLAIASALLVDDVVLGGDIIVVRRKEHSYDPVFLAYYLTQAVKHEIAELTQGITIYHLYGKDLKDLSLSLPPLPEQVEIGKILSTMNAELAALQTRRDKAALLKQGMMQELLTGRTRLVQLEDRHA